MNEFQAASAASKYQNANELATAFGPYTYLNNQYFFVAFTINETHIGAVVIDGRTGNATDIETARKIAFTHHTLRGITVENTAESARDIAEWRQFSRELQELQSEFNDLMASPFLTAAERNELRDWERILTNFERSFNAMIPD